MGSLNDVQIAIPIHKKQEGDLPVDLGDMALKDGLREDRLLARIESNFVDQLIIGHPHAEFDDIKMPGVILFRSIGGKIHVREVGQKTLLFQSQSFATDCPNVYSGELSDPIIRLARIAYKLTNDGLLLLI